MLKGRQSSPAGVVPAESEGGGSKEGGGAGHGSTACMPFKVEDSICAEPHLEVDTEEEPHEGIEETGQT